MEIIWRVISQEGEEGKWEKGEGLGSTIWQVQNRQGNVKNSLGNGVAIDMSWSEEIARGNVAYWLKGDKGEKIGTTLIA